MSAHLGSGSFTVCLGTVAELDNARNSVFGHVAEGLEVVREISLLGQVNEYGTPSERIWVEACGRN